jgi:hypothetical protein
MAQNSPGDVRPTARQYRPLGRAVALGSAFSGGLALAIGVWPDAAARGGATVVIPIVLAIVVTVGLAGAWHVLIGYAADAREAHEHSMAAGFAGAFAVIGIGCSAWFLATLLGGLPALQAYQLEQIDRFNRAAATIVANAEVETSILEAVGGAAGALGNTAADEARIGIVGGKAGKGVVYATVNGAAKSFAGKAAALQKQNHDRDEALGRYREAISAAEQASDDHDDTAFQDNMTRAAGELTNAASIHLSVTDLGSGLETQYAESVIRRAIGDVSAVTDDAAKRLRRVDVPHYTPITERQAIISNPQPLAWIAAIVIELIPALFVGLLLTMWRDEEPQSGEIRPFGRREPFVAAAE